MSATAASNAKAESNQGLNQTSAARIGPFGLIRNDADAVGGTLVPTRTDPTSTLRRMLGIRERRTPAFPVARSHQRDLPGEVIADGLHLLERILPWDAMPATFDGSFAREGELALADLLFFDTETTGLAGGTGTRAFMIGASDFVPQGLRIRQLMMAHMAAESAMLNTFQTWLTPQTRLVSYNGRCYDAPLLNTRYRLARRASPLPELAHTDLLYPTRRRYRGVWENCKLATIERRALGIVREDDLPGSEAPAAWLGYLRGGSSHNLKRVLAHNFQDVVTLARLLMHLAEPAEHLAPSA